MILICMLGWTHDFNVCEGGHMILICMWGWAHDFNLYVGVDT